MRTDAPTAAHCLPCVALCRRRRASSTDDTHPRPRPRMNDAFAWRRRLSSSVAKLSRTADDTDGARISPAPNNAANIVVNGTANAATDSSAFVNHGLQRWNEARNAWTAEPLPQRRATRLSDAQEDDVYDQLVTADNRPFPKHTSLKDVIRILPSVWERERIALMMARP